MGPDQLSAQIQALRARAARYRNIGELLGNAEISAKLDELAGELDSAIEKLDKARQLIAATIEHSHSVWVGPDFEFFMAKLPTQASSAKLHMKAEHWRQVARLWVEEAESSKNHPDKAILAERAFEIAQLAEKLARDVEAQ